MSSTKQTGIVYIFSSERQMHQTFYGKDDKMKVREEIEKIDSRYIRHKIITRLATLYEKPTVTFEGKVMYTDSMQ